jgi:integrase
MATKNLTAAFVKTATCPAGKSKETFFDTECKGLALEVTKLEKKSYYFRYKDERNITRYPKLCDANDITLAQVRELVNKYRGMLALGQDPFAAKAELKQVPTIAAFIADSYLPFVTVNKRSWKTDESLLRNHVLPRFGSLYMDEFTPQHLMKFISEHSKTHANGSVNRVIIIMRYMFNLALRWEVARIKANPTNKIPLLEEHNAKERFLSADETALLITEINKSVNPMLKYIIPTLLMTGCRRNEVTKIKWDDVDIEKHKLRLPPLDNKGKKVRYVPLSEGVIKILKAVPRLDDCEYVFPNPKTKKPYVSFFCSWNTARKAAGLADVRVHDLRHSFASFLVNAGCPIYEVKELLGHTQIKTTQRYAHLSQDTLLKATNKVSAIMAAVNDSSSELMAA